MVKKQIIIFVVLVILIFGGIIGWALVQKSKIPLGEEIAPAEEIFSLSAVVSSVDAENNFLMVKPVNQEKPTVPTQEVKVVLSETTKLIKLELPQEPEKEVTFIPEQTEIELSDFKAGDTVFIKTKTNIAGKTEFDDVDFIHILP